MSFPKRSNEPDEELYRVKSDPPPAGDCPHDAATKVGSMLVDQLMREAEKNVGAEPPRSKPPLPAGPPRPDPSRSGLRPSEIPRVTDEADMSLEPTLVAESPPDSIKACANDDVEALPASRPVEKPSTDVVAAIVDEISRSAIANADSIPKLSSDDDDDPILTEKGTEVMVARPEHASRPSVPSAHGTVPAGPRVAFPNWVGVSMKFDPLEDRRRDLMIRAGIAVGAFVITAAVLFFFFFA